MYLGLEDMDPGKGVLVLVLHLVKDRLHGLLLAERRPQPVLQRRVLPRQVLHLRLHLRNQPPQLERTMNRQMQRKPAMK
jgi:hypothetical protein